MVHENTHQWFGDSVSFKDWRDGCLAECFAEYAGQLWKEHKGADLDTGFYGSWWRTTGTTRRSGPSSSTTRARAGSWTRR
ncbi:MULTISPECIES: M1 family aminopeptidase [unclassified Streptomyces]